MARKLQGGHVAAGQWGGQRGDEARSDTGACVGLGPWGQSSEFQSESGNLEFIYRLTSTRFSVISKFIRVVFCSLSIY